MNEALDKMSIEKLETIWCVCCMLIHKKHPDLEAEDIREMLCNKVSEIGGKIAKESYTTVECTKEFREFLGDDETPELALPACAEYLYRKYEEAQEAKKNPLESMETMGSA